MMAYGSAAASMSRSIGERIFRRSHDAPLTAGQYSG
jgi:hypothetical protein